MHIKPKLGCFKIQLINTERLQQFFNEEANLGRMDHSGGLSSKTLSEMLMIINDIFKFAKSHGETIQCEPYKIVIKKTFHEMRILSLDEERRLNSVLLYNQDIYKHCNVIIKKGKLRLLFQSPKVVVLLHRFHYLLL